MKKYLIPILAGAILSVGTVANANENYMKDRVQSLEKELNDLKSKMKNSHQSGNDDIHKKNDEIHKHNEKVMKRLQKALSEVKIQASHDNIKFSADLRIAYDNLHYTRGNGDTNNGGILTNRFILNMMAKPNDSLIFKGALQVHNLYGTSNTMNGGQMSGYNNSSWFGNETPDDTTMRLKEAYFVYFGELGVPYTASFGRRPATTGMLTNFREDDNAKSPIGHNINMEFDGASFKFDVGDPIGLDGGYFKLCIGRGHSGSRGKYSSDGTPAYAKDASNMDMVGMIAQLYNDGQYRAVFNYFQAYNVLGLANMQTLMDTDPANDSYAMKSVGDISGGALMLQSSGVGDEISDFLDDTTVFASYAWSETEPDPLQGGMLGSMEKQTGNSIYVGVQMPLLLTDGGKFGFEYNKGSEYWRAFTYGEDTLAGSKLATRGTAYEAYVTQPLIGKNLSMQLRYTKMNYDYTGSEGFFGNGGMPMTISQASQMGMNPVEKAEDVRLYIRYRY